MDFHDFVGDVQQRTESAGLGEGVRVTRAVLQTLGERIDEGEAADLAAPLPMEVDWYLTGAPERHGQRFDWSTFVGRVAERSNADEGDAAFYAQTVLALVGDLVPEGELDDLRGSLPDEYGDLFDLVGVEDEAAPR